MNTCFVQHQAGSRQWCNCTSVCIAFPGWLNWSTDVLGETRTTAVSVSMQKWCVVRSLSVAAVAAAVAAASPATDQLFRVCMSASIMLLVKPNLNVLHREGFTTHCHAMAACIFCELFDQAQAGPLNRQALLRCSQCAGNAHRCAVVICASSCSSRCGVRSGRGMAACKEQPLRLQ